MWETFDPWRAPWVAADVAMASRAGDCGLRQRQERRFRSLLCAAAQAPLYQRILRGRDLSRLRLQDMPVTSKPELMASFDDWVTDPAVKLDGLRRFVDDLSRIGDAYLGRYVVWTSSGTSGQACIFIQDANAMAVYDALEALRRPWPRPWQRLADPWFLADRIAFVGALGGHFASVVANRRLQRLNPLLAASLHDLSFMQPLEALVGELNEWRPTILGTYPSAALMLAVAQASGRLSISPREIWTGGETLTPAVRRAVGEVFACPVVDSYGASEFFTLAGECSAGRLHLNSDWAILEPVDKAGRAVEPGELSATVLLTNLANHVQPLIRYDLGDRVRWMADRCACGSPLPCIEVEGRHDDVLWLDARGGSRRAVLPLALATVLEEQAGLYDFQLEQTGRRSFRLHTPQQGEAAMQALQRGLDSLQRFLAGQGIAHVEIRLQCGVPHRLGPGGKLRRVLADETSPRRASFAAVIRPSTR